MKIVRPKSYLVQYIETYNVICLGTIIKLRHLNYFLAAADGADHTCREKLPLGQPPRNMSILRRLRSDRQHQAANDIGPPAIHLHSKRTKYRLPRWAPMSTRTPFSRWIDATDLRISEATGLARSDVDLDPRLLHIRCAKYGKSRWVPIHRTTAAALLRYIGRRDLRSSRCQHRLILRVRPRSPRHDTKCRVCLQGAAFGLAVARSR
jgi:integrase